MTNDEDLRLDAEGLYRTANWRDMLVIIMASMPLAIPA
jgi:hypothetical protein